MPTTYVNSHISRTEPIDSAFRCWPPRFLKSQTFESLPLISSRDTGNESFMSCGVLKDAVYRVETLLFVPDHHRLHDHLFHKWNCYVNFRLLLMSGRQKALLRQSNGFDHNEVLYCYIREKHPHPPASKFSSIQIHQHSNLSAFKQTNFSTLLSRFERHFIKPEHHQNSIQITQQWFLSEPFSFS